MSDTIIMIHGMFAGAWCWDNYKIFFQERGYRCITPELRYHDREPHEEPDPLLGTASLLDYCEDIEKIIRSCGTKPILMSHSMGGLIAQILCSRGLAKAAVLITPSSPRGINAMRFSVINTFITAALKWKFWEKPFKLSFNKSVYSTLHKVPVDEQRKIYDKMAYESGHAAFETGFWPFDKRRASEVDSDKVQCPVLVIASKEDRMTPAAVVKKIARKYESVSTYKEFDNHAHWMLGEPGWQEVAKESSRWINSVLHEAPKNIPERYENRGKKRTRYETSIVFNDHDPEFYNRAVTRDISEGGVHFVSDFALQPGMDIDLKAIENLPPVSGWKDPDRCQAEVVWCSPVVNASFYNVGVRFSESVV